MRNLALLASIAVSSVLVVACPSTIDLQTARQYPCARDGGTPDQCPDGWHCGVEGFCYSRAAADGRAYPCAANEDCAEGWRCGHSGVCQNTRIAAAYACTLDEHCELGWRCGPDGTCVDPSGDALPAELPTEQPRREVVSGTLLNYGEPFQFAASPPQGSITNVTFTFAATTWSELVAAQQGVAFPLPDGGTSDHRVFRMPLEVAASTLPVRDLAAVRGRVFLLGNGGVDELRPFPPGNGSTPIRHEVPTTATELYVTHDRDPETFVIAYGAGQAASFIMGTGSASTPIELPAQTDAGLPTLTGAASLSSFDGPELPAVATAEGIYVGFRAAYDAGVDSAVVTKWAPLALPEIYTPACGTAGTLIPERLLSAAAVGSKWRLYVLTTGGKDARILGYHAPREVRTVVDFTGDCFVPKTPIPLLVNAPNPCGTNRIIGIIPVENEAGEQLHEVRCNREKEHETFNDAFRLRALPDGGSEARLSLVPSGELVSDSTSSSTAWIDRDGRIVFLDEFRFRRPFSPVNLPGAILGRGDALKTVHRPLEQTSSDIFGMEARAGLLRHQVELFGAPVVEVNGHDRWLLRADAGVYDEFGVVELADDDSTTMVAAFPPSEQFKDPYRATIAPLIDGGTELVVSAFDAILATDVTDRSGRRLEVKAVPLSRSPIFSIAPLRPEPGEIAAVYALTQAGLFRVSASSQSRWRSQEIRLPEGDWVDVWVDADGRGRVGYRDGTIYGLPSRTRIADPIGNGVEVQDYADVCGQPFSLSGNTVYAVQREGTSPVGRWKQIDMLFAAGAEEARLRAIGSELVVASGTGDMMRLHVDCPVRLP